MQGLKQNIGQFSLLVLVNAFVGSMIGFERSIMPSFATDHFHIDKSAAIFSFIAAFGITKAAANYLVSPLSSRFSRKKILVAGWLFALPVPFLLLFAPNWGWVVAANILLGMNQGLAWSSTVIMKIDLVGPQKRGLAMGINEFAGYLAVGLASWAAAELVFRNGFTWLSFLPLVIIAVSGLLLSVFAVKDTHAFVQHESSLLEAGRTMESTPQQHRNILSVTINGFVNNMNDGVLWGLLPVLLLSKGLSFSQMGLVAGVYPMVWGIFQLFTGAWGDRYCKKQLISTGMMLQAAGIIALALFSSLILLVAAAVLIGLGTALVYPNFLSVISENTHPQKRASKLSIFRSWRDSGYVAGALLAGGLPVLIGMVPTIIVVGIITAGSGILAEYQMCCTLRKWWPGKVCEMEAVY